MLSNHSFYPFLAPCHSHQHVSVNAPPKCAPSLDKLCPCLKSQGHSCTQFFFTNDVAAVTCQESHRHDVSVRSRPRCPAGGPAFPDTLWCWNGGRQPRAAFWELPMTPQFTLLVRNYSLGWSELRLINKVYQVLEGTGNEKNEHRPIRLARQYLSYFPSPTSS